MQVITGALFSSINKLQKGKSLLKPSYFPTISSLSKTLSFLSWFFPNSPPLTPPPHPHHCSISILYLYTYLYIHIDLSHFLLCFADKDFNLFFKVHFFPTVQDSGAVSCFFAPNPCWVFSSWGMFLNISWFLVFGASMEVVV